MRWFRLALLLMFPVVALGADEPSPLTIEGYTDQLSYRPGDSVAFHISTTAERYSLEISRLG
ncbi:MAG TPA: hypothetical protein VFT74_19180, partial [Isosphaeraceae bacterium]|nr:hypothetical protein [Isosphaeraceae bacterium]